ncbi:unnamed protein product [Amoebophrya sp. A120]|nr:unnamed protein product [Amoebophrya sp. A120]|eukprot:GSA120T00011770001.1
MGLTGTATSSKDRCQRPSKRAGSERSTSSASSTTSSSSSSSSATSTSSSSTSASDSSTSRSSAAQNRTSFDQQGAPSRRHGCRKPARMPAESPAHLQSQRPKEDQDHRATVGTGGADTGRSRNRARRRPPAAAASGRDHHTAENADPASLRSTVGTSSSDSSSSSSEGAGEGSRSWSKLRRACNDKVWWDKKRKALTFKYASEAVHLGDSWVELIMRVGGTQPENGKEFFANRCLRMLDAARKRVFPLRSSCSASGRRQTGHVPRRAGTRDRRREGRPAGGLSTSSDPDAVPLSGSETSVGHRSITEARRQRQLFAHREPKHGNGTIQARTDGKDTRGRGANTRNMAGILSRRKPCEPRSSEGASESSSSSSASRPRQERQMRASRPRGARHLMSTGGANKRSVMATGGAKTFSQESHSGSSSVASLSKSSTSSHSRQSRSSGVPRKSPHTTSTTKCCPERTGGEDVSRKASEKDSPERAGEGRGEPSENAPALSAEIDGGRAAGAGRATRKKRSAASRANSIPSGSGSRDADAKESVSLRQGSERVRRSHSTVPDSCPSSFEFRKCQDYRSEWRSRRQCMMDAEFDLQQERDAHRREHGRLRDHQEILQAAWKREEDASERSALTHQIREVQTELLRLPLQHEDRMFELRKKQRSAQQAYQFAHDNFVDFLRIAGHEYPREEADPTSRWDQSPLPPPERKPRPADHERILSPEFQVPDHREPAAAEDDFYQHETAATGSALKSRRKQEPYLYSFSSRDDLDLECELQPLDSPGEEPGETEHVAEELACADRPEKQTDHDGWNDWWWKNDPPQQGGEDGDYNKDGNGEQKSDAWWSRADPPSWNEAWNDKEQSWLHEPQTHAGAESNSAEIIAEDVPRSAPQDAPSHTEIKPLTVPAEPPRQEQDAGVQDFNSAGSRWSAALPSSTVAKGAHAGTLGTSGNRAGTASYSYGNKGQKMHPSSSTGGGKNGPQNAGSKFFTVSTTKGSQETSRASSSWRGPTYPSAKGSFGFSKSSSKSKGKGGKSKPGPVDPKAHLDWLRRSQKIDSKADLHSALEDLNLKNSDKMKILKLFDDTQPKRQAPPRTTYHKWKAPATPETSHHHIAKRTLFVSIMQSKLAGDFNFSKDANLFSQVLGPFVILNFL